MPTTITRMTWKDIVKKEPRLANLLSRVRSLDRQQERFCKHELWVEGDAGSGMPPLKCLVTDLAGWWARAEELKSEEAWSVVAEKLLSEAPPCRSCGCVDACGRFID